MNSTEVEYLIIGAGPAGLQLGYFLEKANRNYLILEAGDTAGTFFKKFPRHRKLISINKVYTGSDNPEMNLRWDWNSLLNDSDKMLFKNYSKRYFPKTDFLVNYLKDFADFFQLKIKYGVQAVRISKDSKFRVIDKNGNVYYGKRLIIATGLSQPYIPEIPGIELVEQYTEVSTDPEAFINQKVLIIGKGNSAFETAENLIETASVIHVASPNSINMAWKSHFVGHLRAVNNNFLDTYQLKCQNALLDATIEKIQRLDNKFVVSVKYSHANNETEDLIYDRVIACTGFRFDASIFDENCCPELTINNRFPQQTSEWESTNVKELYFVGTLTQMRDFKKSASGFIHGFRYNIRALHHIFDVKYHGQKWPSQKISSTPQEIVDIIIKRINTSSALWQQFGFLGDVITISQDGRNAQYYEELPVDYIHDSQLGQHTNYYILTLEFGNAEKDPFRIERYPQPHQAEKSAFLHPIIRHYKNGKLISKHHLLEDLDGQWIKVDAHIKPLLEFFTKNLLLHASSRQPKLVSLSEGRI
jgi:thioredoxin reductase